ncbi:DUF2254 domain-containing protein [Acetoanaerobium sticklandii]|uniref:DUF2254 domain-containing protein n=1 Tax=Acetoanaerobium sticklandii TaxID=1511 RepID=UPI003A9415B7
MKKIINKIKTSIWLYPTIYSIGAFILSVVIKILETTYSDEMSLYLSTVFYTKSELAQTVLGIVASAFITIATFTFSTTMVVLTMYSSQFTPRVVENFLNNRVTMKSFGVFLSGFIFAISSLLFTKTSQNENLVISASIGVIYVIVGLVYFLIFIHNVATYVQASHLIQRLQDEAQKKIKEYNDFEDKASILSKEEMIEMVKYKYFFDVYAHSDGYIQEINYQKLQKIAQNHNCIICFKKVVGQFISLETKILTIYYEEKNILDEIDIEEINKLILIGNKKTQTQDFSFTIQKIVEIAVKALSPGINDPNTAIHCLNIIGILLRDLSHIEKGYILLKKDDELGHIIYEAYDFEVLLDDAFSQIIFYGQADVSVIVVALKSLRIIKTKASKYNKEIIDNYAKYLIEKQLKLSDDKLHHTKIENEYVDLINL